MGGKVIYCCCETLFLLQLKCSYIRKLLLTVETLFCTERRLGLNEYVIFSILDIIILVYLAIHEDTIGRIGIRISRCPVRVNQIIINNTVITK
jgi:hypothetical protein